MLIGVRDNQFDSDERELIDAARREDRGPFKALHERYRDRVCNLAFYWLGEAVWAEVMMIVVTGEQELSRAAFQFLKRL